MLVEQLAAVNPETRLGDYAGRLTSAELAGLDRALSIVLGLF